MKNISIFLFIILFNKVNSQTGKILYKVNPKVANSDNERVKKTYEEIELFTFSLNFNSEESFFKKENNVPSNELNSKIASILVKGNVDYHQYNALKNTLFYLEIDSKRYLINKSNRMTGWKLANEKKNIDGYECYKATLHSFNERAQKETIVTAWYTPSIPAPYGPVGYGGLPGLILELKTAGGFIYSPISITLNPKKNKIEKIEKGEEINSKKMNILMRKARKVTKD